MFWDTLYAAGAIAVSTLGGASVVIALSTWLGKVWAYHILEKDRARYQREVGESLQLLQDRIERGQLIHRLQFSLEFKVYRKLWDKVVRVKSAALALRPIVDFVPLDKTLPQIEEERLAILRESFKPFKECYICNKPFFAQEVYDMASKLSGVVWDESWAVANRNTMSPDRIKDYWDTAQKNAKLIEEYSDDICKAIRNRISSLSVLLKDSNQGYRKE
jgi:hypothetical protein